MSLFLGEGRNKEGSATVVIYRRSIRALTYKKISSKNQACYRNIEKINSNAIATYLYCCNDLRSLN